MGIDKEKLLDLMAERGLTMRQLAKKAEVADGTVLRAAHGQAVSNIVTIGKIARALGVERSDIMTQED